MPQAPPPPGQAPGQAANGAQLIELVVPPHVTAGMQVRVRVRVRARARVRVRVRVRVGVGVGVGVGV